MKLVINANDGTITAETSDDVSAAQFVRELLSGHKPAPPPKAIEAKPVTKKPAKRRKRKLAPPKADRPLSKALDETWAYLAAADRAGGVHISEVAKAFNLTDSGAGQRLYALIERHMAWRVSIGYYRVGSPVDGALLNGAGTH
jgi:hypothetical protein